jgi:hypothetical protein
MKNRIFLAAALLAAAALAGAQTVPAAPSPKKTKTPRVHAASSKTPNAETAAFNAKVKAADDTERSELQALSAKNLADMNAVAGDATLSAADKTAKLDALRKAATAQRKAIGDKARTARKSARPVATERAAHAKQ